MNTDINLKTLTQIKAEITNLRQEYDFDFCFESWKVEKRQIRLSKNCKIGDLSIERRRDIYGIHYKGNHFFHHDAYSLGLFKTIIKKMSQDKELLDNLEKVYKDAGKIPELEREKMRLEIINKYSIYNKIADLKHRGKYLTELDSFYIVYAQERIEDLEERLIEEREKLKQYKNDKETLVMNDGVKQAINIIESDLNEAELNLSNLGLIDEDLIYLLSIEKYKSYFVNLEWLDLENNNLTNLPENIFDNLINLEWIDLGGNKLESLPENIKNKKGLTIYGEAILTKL